MPKAFTIAEKQIIQAKLIEQGDKMFSTYGLRKTNVEELARAAGISKGAFYLFYESKEALFMTVIEEAEAKFQQGIIDKVQATTGNDHHRLYTVLRHAFTRWKELPILHLFTRQDYEVLARRLPQQRLEAHSHKDLGFAQALITQCHQTGIVIQIEAKEMSDLLHTLFFASLHENDLGPNALSNAINLLLKMTTAYCLGDINLTVFNPSLENKNDPHK